MGRYLFNRSELATTSSELSDIPIAAAQGGTKPAKLSTGAVVKVPLFINQGEIIRVDTRSGEYQNRVSK